MKLLKLALILACFSSSVVALTSENGLELTGKIPSDPPSQAARITIPSNGQSFTELPVTVQGICENGLIVKVFKNDVFAGAGDCSDSSFSVDIDLFSGQNDLVAIVYDQLDQEGPESNTVTVTYQDSQGVSNADGPILSSMYARRGVNPQKTLTWPINISQGQAPYAIKVDWGDGQEDLLTLDGAGKFNIKNVYQSSGSYRVLVKATDNNDNSAYLQLVAIVNGPLLSTYVDDQGKSIVSKYYDAWPFLILLVFIYVSFWLGRKYTFNRIRNKLQS